MLVLSGPRIQGIALRQRVAPTGAFLLWPVRYRMGRNRNDKRAVAYV